MAFIEVIRYEQATGQLREIYDDLVKKRGKLAEVHKIQSLNPQSIVDHMNLYMTVMFGRSPLSRAEREMAGVIVSATNHCKYCVKHHSDALQFYWKNEERVGQLSGNFREIDLSEREQGLCTYAEAVTRNSPGTNFESLNVQLKKCGLTDREILDLTLVIAYFNFVNRIVLSLDVQPETDTGGYKY